MSDPGWLLVSVLALAGLSILAYALRALDFLGAVASFMLGVMIATLGGLSWIFLMVLFTALSLVATRMGRSRKRALGIEESKTGERGVANVMGNGAAAGLVVLAGQMDGIPTQAVLLAFTTAVAAVCADTLASEVGGLAARSRSILPPFRMAVPGQNGAVSWAGQFAALFGALAISIAAVYVLGVPRHLVWIPALGGWIGCQVDSLLGATLERGGGREGPLSKQDVNFLASALPAIVVLAAFSAL